MGRPSIVSDQGGLPELVENGRTGYITKAGNVLDLTEKIREMSNSQMDTAYISDKAARTYSADLYAEYIIGLYEKLIRLRPDS